jgi:hypothetical protein
MICGPSTINAAATLIGGDKLLFRQNAGVLSHARVKEPRV